MAFTPVTVTGRYLLPDGTTPAAGTVAFYPSAPMQDGADNEIVTQAQTVATLNAQGEISVPLVANDDPTTAPTGVTYQVVERITGGRLRVYSISLHAASAPSVDLADLSPVQPQPATYDYALVSTVNALDTRVTALESRDVIDGGTP